MKVVVPKGDHVTGPKARLQHMNFTGIGTIFVGAEKFSHFKQCLYIHGQQIIGKRLKLFNYSNLDVTFPSYTKEQVDPTTRTQQELTKVVFPLFLDICHSSILYSNQSMYKKNHIALLYQLIYYSRMICVTLVLHSVTKMMF